jgi:class 3 adenylate cyclase
LSGERVERRLTAILAADVAGYSRLMGLDEAGTLARLRAHRRELIDPEIAEHRGRIVKTTGDGLLIEFPSVVEAVACAVAVQRGMAERNTPVPEDQRIVFRVGVNLGDIIVEGDDIHGDGVNVAARLEAISEPGGICVSGIVHDQVEGKLDIAFADGGEPPLKNIARPIHVYHVHSGSGPHPPIKKPVTRQGPLWEESRSRFRPTGEALGITDDRRRVVLDNDPALWLKIGPLPDCGFHRYGPSIRTDIQTKNVLQLLPLRFYTGDADFILANDGFGYSQTPPRGTFITETVTFIFETGTLWAVDTQILKQFGTIPFIHSDLVTAFKNFTALLDHYLGVPLPLRWQIGMEQLQNRRVEMVTPTGQWSHYGRECTVERIVKEGRAIK